MSGIDAESLDVIKDFYDSIFQTTVPASGPKAAEMAKLIENVFRFVNVSMINELAILAAALGVDAWEAIDAAAPKPFGFTRFTPGPGVGGHCHEAQASTPTAWRRSVIDTAPGCGPDMPDRPHHHRTKGCRLPHNTPDGPSGKSAKGQHRSDRTLSQTSEDATRHPSSGPGGHPLPNPGQAADRRSRHDGRQ
ncbi:hypothetical protein [Streptomyces sp. NPDC001744]|uniref:hypothetical protein n=1 Tax=Streptomyces sp. NPDC001744 TaxID=3364606 RepID=UPI00368600CB